MTVGTGIGEGSDERAKNLAHGLACSIKEHIPDKVIFFGSGESELTVIYIKFWLRDWNISEPENELIINHNIDDFSEYFNLISRYIAIFSKDTVLIDYTSGTKTMTMAAAIVSFLYHRELVFVHGERSGGIVKKGTEIAEIQVLYPAYDRYLFERSIQYFNRDQFRYALDTLDETISIPDKEDYSYIYKGYEAWDRLDHKGAYFYLSKISYEKIKDNQVFLHRLVGIKSVSEEKYILVLSSLLNNVERRIKGGLFDEAVARLYRSVELIVQILLLRNGVDDISQTINFDMIKSKIFDRETLAKWHYEAGLDNKLKIGLYKKCRLLQDLGEREAFIPINRFKNFIEKRHSSILAHGLEPVEGETAIKFFQNVKDYALSLDGFADSYMMSKFPELEI